MLFKKQDVNSIRDAILHFKNLTLNPEEIRENALRFDEKNFKTNFNQFVQKQYEVFKKDK